MTYWILIGSLSERLFPENILTGTVIPYPGISNARKPFYLNHKEIKKVLCPPMWDMKTKYLNLKEDCGRKKLFFFLGLSEKKKLVRVKKLNTL